MEMETVLKQGREQETPQNLRVDLDVETSPSSKRECFGNTKQQLMEVSVDRSYMHKKVNLELNQILHILKSPKNHVFEIPS